MTARRSCDHLVTTHCMTLSKGGFFLFLFFAKWAVEHVFLASSLSATQGMNRLGRSSSAPPPKGLVFAGKCHLCRSCTMHLQQMPRSLESWQIYSVHQYHRMLAYAHSHLCTVSVSCSFFFLFFSFLPAIPPGGRWGGKQETFWKYHCRIPKCNCGQWKVLSHELGTMGHGGTVVRSENFEKTDAILTLESINSKVLVSYGVLLFHFFQALDRFGSLDARDSLSLSDQMNPSLITSRLAPASTKPRSVAVNKHNSDFGESVVSQNPPPQQHTHSPEHRPGSGCLIRPRQAR
jgi:hypothetical protein